MKKWIKCGGIFFLILFLMQGCSIERMDKQKVADLEFTIVEDSQVPVELLNMIEAKKESQFKMTFDTGDAKYIVIGYGKQETGGYSITVDELYLSQNAIYVDTTLLGPAKGEVVNEALSYPYIVIKINQTDKNVVFE